MSYQELFDFLQHVGKDPSRLVFEDELIGIQNRRFLLSYLEHKVRWDKDADFPLALAIIRFPPEAGSGQGCEGSWTYGLFQPSQNL